MSRRQRETREKWENAGKIIEKCAKNERDGVKGGAEQLSFHFKGIIWLRFSRSNWRKTLMGRRRGKGGQLGIRKCAGGGIKMSCRYKKRMCQGKIQNWVGNCALKNLQFNRIVKKMAFSIFQKQVVDRVVLVRLVN